MHLNRLLLLIALLFLETSARSEEPQFSVAIVGYRCTESHVLLNRPEGAGAGTILPIVYFPREPVDKFVPSINQPTGKHFYVVITNTKDEPVRLEMSQRLWFDCFAFSLSVSDGQAKRLFPRPVAWRHNEPRVWYFPPRGARIVAIDFGGGSWDTFPLDVAKPMFGTLTATFTYLTNDDSIKHEISSEPTRVSIVDRSLDDAFFEF